MSPAEVGADLPYIGNHWFTTVSLRVTGLCKSVEHWTDPKIKVHKSPPRQPSTKEDSMVSCPFFQGHAPSHLPPCTCSFHPAPFSIWLCHHSGENWSHCRGRGNLIKKLFYCISISWSEKLLHVDERICKMENHSWETLLPIQPCFKLWATSMRIRRQKKIRTKMKRKNQMTHRQIRKRLHPIYFGSELRFQNPLSIRNYS